MKDTSNNMTMKERFHYAALLGGHPWAEDDASAKYYDEALSPIHLGWSAFVKIQGSTACTSEVQEIGEDGVFRTKSRWYIPRPEGVDLEAFGPEE